jgi:hypothetical protein
VHSLLRNPLCIGKVRGKDGETHLGEHEPIISIEIFDKVAAIMNQRTTGRKRMKRPGETEILFLECMPGQQRSASARCGQSRE